MSGHSGQGGCAAVGEGWARTGGSSPLLLPPWLCRDAKEPDTMKEESGTDASAHSRKRKANVAVVSTKETGGGGWAPHLTWVPDWALPLYLLIGGYVHRRSAVGGNAVHSLTNFLFLLSVFFVFGLFGVFPWGWGCPVLVFAGS